MAARDVAAPVPALRGKRIRWSEVVVRAVLALAALISIATTIGIIAALLQPSVDFFRDVSIVDFLTGTTWSPLFEPAHFGVQPLVVGTLLVSLVACLVAIPF